MTGTKKSLNMLRLLRIPKLFRLFRINRLFRHVKMVVLWIEERLHIRISDGFTKLVRLGIGALVLGHWIGCFNFMLVRMHDFPSDSWVVYAALDDKDPFVQWSWSFFKALAQMIMIGFETPPYVAMFMSFFYMSFFYFKPSLKIRDDFDIFRDADLPMHLVTQHHGGVVLNIGQLLYAFTLEQYFIRC